MVLLCLVLFVGYCTVKMKLLIKELRIRNINAFHGEYT
jgi:hypothetical protein